MLPAPFRIFNPGTLQSDSVVLKQFVVRTRTLAKMLALLRAAPCRHILVEGDTGYGKTMLLAALAARLREDDKQQPEAGTPLLVQVPADPPPITQLDFWRAVLLCLSPELGAQEDRGITEVLAGIATTVAKEGAPAKGLVLMVDNIHDITFVADLIPEIDAQSYTLVATATRLNNDAARALFTHKEVLPPLSFAECAVLWKAATGVILPEREEAAIEILTEGNPRLVAMLARIARASASSSLCAHFVELLDARTGAFRSYMESLPPQERRVYSTVVDLWAASSPSAIAERAHMKLRPVSTLLGRLVTRGHVKRAGAGGRRRYAATDPLVCFYRRVRTPTLYGRAAGAERASQLLRFIEALYTEEHVGRRWEGLPAQILGQRTDDDRSGRQAYHCERVNDDTAFVKRHDHGSCRSLKEAFDTITREAPHKLKGLAIYDAVGSIPPEIEQLTSLEQFWLIGASAGCELQSPIGKMKKLKALRMKGVNWSPKEVTGLERLEELWIEECAFSVADIEKLPVSLKRLRVGDIVEMPDVKKLENLEELTCVGSSMSEVAVERLPNDRLACLIIAGSRRLSFRKWRKEDEDPLLGVSKEWPTAIESIPDTITKLKHLRELWIVGGGAIGNTPTGTREEFEKVTTRAIFGGEGYLVVAAASAESDAGGLESLRRYYDRDFAIGYDIAGDAIRKIAEHVIELSARGAAADRILDVLTGNAKKEAALRPLVLAMRLRGGATVGVEAGVPAAERAVADDIIRRVERRIGELAAEPGGGSSGVWIGGTWVPALAGEVVGRKEEDEDDGGPRP